MTENLQIVENVKLLLDKNVAQNDVHQEELCLLEAVAWQIAKDSGYDTIDEAMDEAERVLENEYDLV